MYVEGAKSQGLKKRCRDDEVQSVSSVNSMALEQSDDVIDPRELFAEIWCKRWWVIGSAVFMTGVLTAVAFLTTPVYRATAVLISASTDRNTLSGSLSSALGDIGGLAALTGLSLDGGDADLQEALAVLRSREFTERFIKDRNLMTQLFSSQWDPNQKNWKGEADEHPTLFRAYKHFDKKIRKISQDRKTSLITVDIDWCDPIEAATWANELVDRLNQEMRQRAIHNSEASIEYLEKELSETNLVGTKDAISRLIEAQIKQRMIANVTREYAFRVVDKALPPDVKEPLRPQKLLLILAGPIVGFFIGMLAVVGLYVVRRLWQPPAKSTHSGSIAY